ncbi:NUDIX hydrolase [Candidatus Dojkabacteria bacterium]|nr:NUDIX hydrolase [Candidatus Dojkabacteria bacterium]
MKRELAHNRRWYPDTQIREEHKNLEVRQVTCFVISKDKKLLLVSKDESSWSITAGHYEQKKDSTYIDTAIREVYEESGLHTSSQRNSIKEMGYYIVEDIEKKTGKILEKYIQIRMFLRLDKEAKDLSLKPNEKDQVKYAQFFSLEKSLELIRWLEESPEWKIISVILH